MRISRKLMASTAMTVAVFAAIPVFAQDAEISLNNGDVEMQVELPAPPPELLLGADVLALTVPDEMPAVAPEQASFSAPAIAYGSSGGGECPFTGKPGCGPLSGMTLTDDQYEKMWQIKRAASTAAAAKMGEVMAASLELKDLMMQPNLDRSKLKSAHDRLNSARNDLSNIKFNERLDFMGVLTEEQRKEMRRSMLKKAACPRGGMMMRSWHHRR